MNNKGQVLVIFIIILPILLLVLGFVIELGLVSVEKRKIDNNVYDAVCYYKENIDKEDVLEKTKNLLNNNLDDINIQITNNDIYVDIEVSKKYKEKFNFISKDYEIKIIYKIDKETKKILKG